MSAAPRDRLASAHLYLVCDELPDAQLHAALAGGVDMVQLRMKSAGDERILATAARYGAACAEHGALLIINDRPDLAALAGADGVHVGQGDLAVARARELVGPERIVGLSASAPEEVDAAERSDADYIGVGPIISTPTKPEQAGVGMELVRYAAQVARKPFFAIGGIDTVNVAAFVAAGARGVAVVRALTDAPDPERAARQLRSAFGGVPVSGVSPAGVSTGGAPGARGSLR
ncbi:MAG: thiamine phosphate synthase [Solirubrobacteraceae bacterium]